MNDTAQHTSSHQGTILVTGAGGHLGANLVRFLLRSGHSVRVMIRRNDNNEAVDGLPVERVYGDLRSPSEVREAASGCRRIFHTAAKVSTIDGDAKHQREIFESNVIGTRNVLAAARECGVERTVVTGSFSAVGYDLDNPSLPANENMQFYPFERTMPYERSKVLVEHECLAAVAEGQDVVIATSCAIVGGNDFLPSRMGRTLCDYANGKLRAYVPGGFEFVAAQDIARGHVLAMERGRSGHKYIISSEYLTIDQIMDLFEDVTGVPRSRLRLPSSVMLAFSEVASAYLSKFHPDFPQRLTPGAIRLLRLQRHADTSKAKTELGFQPTSIHDAIREAYAFHYARGAIRNTRAHVPQDETPSNDRSTDPTLASQPKARVQPGGRAAL